MRIRHALALTLLTGLIVSCASSSNDGSSSNAPEVALIQTYSTGETMYMRGPIALDYVLVVENKTNQPFRLTRLDLQTIGAGAYSLRTRANTLNHVIAPNGRTNVKISAWGQARGGFVAQDEPVNIHGIAYFTTPSGTTVRQVFTQLLGQSNR
jgi:hypothetical protein